MAVISLVQRIGGIELASLPEQYLDYYRNFVLTLTGWIPLPFGWSIAQWYADLMSIGAVLLLTLGRTEKIAPLQPEPGIVNYVQNMSKSEKILRNIGGLIFFTFLVLLAPLAIIFSIMLVVRAFIFMKEGGLEMNFGHRVQSLDSAVDYWFKTLSLLLMVILVATFLFFLLNGVT